MSARHRSWANETHELAAGLFVSRYRNGALERYELVDDRDARGDELVIDFSTAEMVELGARLWEWIAAGAELSPPDRVADPAQGQQR